MNTYKITCDYFGHENMLYPSCGERDCAARTYVRNSFYNEPNSNIFEHSPLVVFVDEYEFHVHVEPSIDVSAHCVRKIDA